MLSAEIIQEEKTDIARVWAGHPVDFAIACSGDFQCVAFYDTARVMTVAARTAGLKSWSFKKLPTTTGWDSHNYIDMAIDDSGYIHISGDMHNVALKYFRSGSPYDISTFISPGMIGSLENSVTYPVFIEGPNGKLIFQYRDGGSGNGTTIWNEYNIVTKNWSRITSQGLFNGGGEVNAYGTSPVLGPDGFFHVVWMWRDTPTANTNHHLSHIKSQNLLNWQTMSGQSVQIPVTQTTAGVVVDPVTSGNGLINMDFGIGWDKSDRPTITYHRYNSNNISQIFNTRFENNAWKIYQTSNWTSFKWDLDRTGSLTHDIAAEPLEIDDNGMLIQNYVYRDNVKRRWILNETTLKPSQDQVVQPPAAMQQMYEVESAFPDMQVNIKKCGEYYMRWETLPINQDQARTTYPSSSMLRIYHFVSATPALLKANHPSMVPVVSIRKGQEELAIVLSGEQNIKQSPWSVSVYNVNGQRILESTDITSASRSFSTENWVPGMYIVRLHFRNSGRDCIRFVHKADS